MTELGAEYVCDLLSDGDGIAKVQGPAGASCGHWKLPDAPSVFRQGYSPQPPTQEERIIFGDRHLGLPSPDGLLAFPGRKSHRKCLISASASVGRRG